MPTKKDQSKKSRLSSVTTSSHGSPESPAAVSSLLRCVPRQKPLVYGRGLQLRVAESLQSSRPSLQPEGPDSTRGLGSCHPTIRDWNERRAIKIISSPLVTQREKPTGSLKSRYLHDNRLDGCVRSNQLVAAVLGGRSGVSFGLNDKNPGALYTQSTLQESAPTEAAGITALDNRYAQKRTVRFAEEDAKNKPATVLCVTTAGTSANISDRASRHSHTLTYPPTLSVERSIDSIFSSVASLTSLTDCHSGSLTSIPSLPLIQSNTLNKRSSAISSGSSSSFIIQSHPSERDIICPMTGVASVTGRKEPNCAVINLRIPFGKVEEWDVPQKKIPIETNTVDTGESQQSKDSESASGLTNNQATLSKFE